MDYKKHYELLIETRRNRIVDVSSYYEKHHIIPRSMCGTDDDNNLILLTAREHFIAHWLLWRIHRNQQMAFAFFCMCKMSNYSDKVSSRAYEEAKLVRSEFIIQFNKTYHLGKKLSKNEIEIISRRFKGVSKSIEHKEKISKSLTGKVKTQSHKNKISEKLKEFDWSSYTERNKKISLKNSGNGNGRSKKVFKYDLDLNIVETFDTMKDALQSIKTNISKTTFYRYVCSNKIIDNFIYSFILK
jgi:hypothetical protein